MGPVADAEREPDAAAVDEIEIVGVVAELVDAVAVFVGRDRREVGDGPQRLVGQVLEQLGVSERVNGDHGSFPRRYHPNLS